MPARRTWRKTRPGAPPAYYRIEAAGLDWLRVPAGPPVPEVLTVAADRLVLQRVSTLAPTAAGCEDFGRRLALLHQHPASFGCAPAGVQQSSGYIADLPLPFGRWDDFGTFYAEARVAPYVRVLADGGGLGGSSAATFEALIDALSDPSSGVSGPGEPASRIHGDLWSGNVLWGADPDNGQVTGWLIDPAAHGGHRETDLAMLALFGLPGLDHVLAGYDQVAPLAPGWRSRTALHQVHPLLVHAVLFGGGYLARARSAAVAALRAV